jgi:hypothetical protein
MAHLGFTRTVTKAGASKAAGRIAYLTRRDRSQPREDLLAVGTRNLPAWAKGEALTYFQAAETYERASPDNVQRRGVAFEEWRVTLPYELSPVQNQALIDDLLATIVGDRLPCTWAFHAPPTLSGSHAQPHLHLLLSARITDGLVRTPQTYFTRFNRQAPEQGGAQKDPAFWTMGAVKAHRCLISDVINLHLEAQGLPVRVHPDRLEVRGIARTPELKLLPSESAAYRTHGTIGTAMTAVLHSRRRPQATRTQELQQASAAWQVRKSLLGITPGLRTAEAVATLLLRRYGTVERIPARYQAVAMALTPQPQRRERGVSLAAQVRALAARLGEHDHALRPGKEVRLWDREADEGRSW